MVSAGWILLSAMWENQFHAFPLASGSLRCSLAYRRHSHRVFMESSLSASVSAWKWKWKWSCVWLFVTPWTVAHQAPLSMGFSRQESWSGLPFPSKFSLFIRTQLYWIRIYSNNHYLNLSSAKIPFPGKVQSLGLAARTLTSLLLLLFSHSVMYDSAAPWTAPHQASLSSRSPRACSNLCPLSQWCHPTISSSIVPFSSCL